MLNFRLKLKLKILSLTSLKGPVNYISPITVFSWLIIKIMNNLKHFRLRITKYTKKIFINLLSVQIITMGIFKHTTKYLNKIQNSKFGLKVGTSKNFYKNGLLPKRKVNNQKKIGFKEVNHQVYIPQVPKMVKIQSMMNILQKFQSFQLS